MEEHAVFVDTSLDTHLALPAYPSETVFDLKEKIRHGHLSCFPNIGEIKVNSLKVYKRDQFYHIADCVPLKCVFALVTGAWRLSADAVPDESATREMMMIDEVTQVPGQNTEFVNQSPTREMMMIDGGTQVPEQNTESGNLNQSDIRERMTDEGTQVPGQNTELVNPNQSATTERMMIDEGTQVPGQNTEFVNLNQSAAVNACGGKKESPSRSSSPTQAGSDVSSAKDIHVQTLQLTDATKDKDFPAIDAIKDKDFQAIDAIKDKDFQAIDAIEDKDFQAIDAIKDKDLGSKSALDSFVEKRSQPCLISPMKGQEVGETNRVPHSGGDQAVDDTNGTKKKSYVVAPQELQGKDDVDHNVSKVSDASKSTGKEIVEPELEKLAPETKAALLDWAVNWKKDDSALNVLAGVKTEAMAQADTSSSIQSKGSSSKFEPSSSNVNSRSYNSKDGGRKKQKSGTSCSPKSSNGELEEVYAPDSEST